MGGIGSGRKADSKPKSNIWGHWYKFTQGLVLPWWTTKLIYKIVGKDFRVGADWSWRYATVIILPSWMNNAEMIEG